MTLTSDPKERKARPIGTGVLDYFPDALAEVAYCSKVGNDQHNPGQKLHWAREKSTDEADAMIRHFLERGKIDTDGVRHSAKMAWRALALLQKEIENETTAVHVANETCWLCGASERAHTDVRGEVRGHEVNMPGMPQHGDWHPFSPGPAPVEY